MTRAAFRRPDGRDGNYGEWAADLAARWGALSAAEQSVSRTAAAARLKAKVEPQDDGPTLMHLYDEIGWFGIGPADVVDTLAGINGAVEVHLNSPGGNVFDGMAIYAALKAHPGEVSVVIDGLAASAASFIAMAAAPGKLAMTPNGTMMIHDAWGGCMGSADDMASMADLLNRSSDNIASIYASRNGRTPAEMRDLMKAETWAVGQEAVDMRLADTVTGSAPAGPPVTADPALAAPGAWQVTIIAGEPAQPANAVDNSPWDGSKAMANGAAADDPAAFYAGICAGRKAGDAAKQDSWALPYKYHPGDGPNAAGTANALSRLPQTQGLTNAAQAKATLVAAMKQVNPDYEADDLAEPDVWAGFTPEMFRLPAGKE